MNPVTHELLHFLLSKGFEITQPNKANFTANISNGKNEQYTLNCIDNIISFIHQHGSESTTLIHNLHLTHAQDILMIFLSSQSFIQCFPELGKELKDELFDMM